MRCESPASPMADLGRAFRLPRAVGVILAVAIFGVQACGGEDGATEPTPTSTGAFTLAAPPAPVPILLGGSGEANIGIVRSGGFAGSVSLAVTGAPAGVTATMNPSITTGTVTTLIVTTAAGAAAGSTILTITGTAAGRPDQTTTATVVITQGPGGAGNVTIDFSGCPATAKPIWVAYQDGSALWTQILGSADVYRFNVASAKGGYAFVSRDRTTTVTVSLATQAELTASTILPCGSTSAGQKRLFGSVTGLGAGDVAYVGMGGPNPDAEGGPIATSFTLTGIHDGNQDLIAYRSNPSALGERARVIIRRDQNIADNGTIGTIDFESAESFAPATAAVTVTGAGFAQIGYSMAYYTGDGCSYYDLYDHPNSGTSFTMRGIPAARQRATDVHRIAVYASDEKSFRFGTESFRALADRSVVVPAELPNPTITALPGRYKRIQATLTLPSEYQTSLQLFVFVGTGTTIHTTASFRWLGGVAATLTSPDFSGVTGWSQSFVPASEASASWYLAASGANSAAAGGPCAESARFVTAYTSGRG